MKQSNPYFYQANPEGIVIVALDARQDDLLSGAVELLCSLETWLEYETTDGVISLYRPGQDDPVMACRVRSRQVEVLCPPERLLVFWNRGKLSLTIGGTSLPPGEIFALSPDGKTPWLLRPAPWLPRSRDIP